MIETKTERVRRCTHRGILARDMTHTTLRGWAIEHVYAPNRHYWRCRRCGGIFFPRFPLEEALGER